jgi:Na+/H+-dicarboxylate symporter
MINAPGKTMKISLNEQIFTGASLGIAFGVILGHSHLPPAKVFPWLSGFDLLGKIFIDLLKMIMIPLVFTSITAGVANLKRTPRSKIWPTLIVYSLTTTALAATTGLIAMNLIKPGTEFTINLSKEMSFNSLQIPPLSFTDFAHKLIDGLLVNPFTAMSQNNILPVVVIGLLTGIAVRALGDKAETVLKLINELFEITMTIVRWIMRLAPMGIMGLLAKLVAQANVSMLYVLGKYVMVVMGATLFHGLITLPLILWLVTKTPPMKFFLRMKEALITAFATSSSTATLPVSLRCLSENLKVDPNIARFVLPVGATLNMDGTAMYEAMAALFVANLCGVHLTLLSQVVVALTAMAASVGAPGIPSAGMVTMVMVLQAVGLPVAAVAILIAIDRPLDTLRTVVNVEGDCIGACVVQKMAKLKPDTKIFEINGGKILY